MALAVYASARVNAMVVMDLSGAPNLPGRRHIKIMEIIHTYAPGSRAIFHLTVSRRDVEVEIARVCLDSTEDVLYVVHEKGDRHKWTALPRDLTPTQDSRFVKIVIEDEAFLKAETQ
jgi:hypothetical protein